MKSIVLTLFFSVFLQAVQSQSLNPASIEQLVNTDIPPGQFATQIASAPDGSYTVIWITGQSSGQLKARRYDSSHNAVGGEVMIDPSVSISKFLNIEHWKNGKYVISYVLNSTLKFLVLDELNNVGTGITVSTTVAFEKQDFAIKGDSLAFLYSRDSDKQLYLRGYNLSANAWFNSEVRITEQSHSYVEAPNIIYHSNGRLTAIYHQIIATGCCIAERKIMRKTFNSSFLAEIPEYALWAPGIDNYISADMEATGNSNGEVMIVTTHGEYPGTDKLRLWILGSTGTFIVNNTVLLNGNPYAWQLGTRAQLYDNGDYVIAKSFWIDLPNGNMPANSEEVYVIYGKNYDQSRSAALQVNSTGPGEQDQPAIAKLPNGGFVVAWSGNGFQGDSRGINVRAYNAVTFPGVAFSAAGTFAVNEGGTTTIGVTLGTQPAGNVTVDLSSSDLTEGTVSPAQLTFTSTNWNVVQNITVNGVDDTNDDGNISFNLIASTTGSIDAGYAALANKNQAITNMDNDATITMPSAQSFCKTTGMSNVNALISNVGAAITSVTATSSDQNVADNSDITINNLGSGTYGIVINNLNNNTTGTAQITLTANDGQFNYTGSFNITTTGITITTDATANSICQGESITLSATGAQNITWSNGVLNNVPFSPTTTTTYTATGDNGAGCSGSATETITVNPTPVTPTITPGGPTAFCAGGSVTLTSSEPSGNTWSNGSTASSITVSAAGTYTVSQGGTCSATSAPVTVIVNNVPSAPAITPNGPTTFCAGGSVTLTSSQATGNSWSTSAVSQSIDVTSTNTYLVTYTDGNGCTSPATSILVTVQAAPNVSAGPDQTVCEGEMVTLLGSGATSYSWTGGITNGVPFDVNNQATFEVTGTGSNGCTNTDQVTVFVNNAPNVSAGPNLVVCNGASITLNGNGALTYDWDNGVTNGVSFVPTPGTTTYTVTGTNAAGCEAEDEMTVTVNQLPNVSISPISIFCLSDGAAALTQGTPSGGTYTGTGITGVVFSPSTAGLGIHPLTYTYTDLNGCQNTASSTVTVDQCLGIDETAEAKLSVYPNPTSGLASIEFPGSFNYSVADAQGRKVLDGKASEVAQLDLSAFGNGVYQVLVQTENTSIMIRLVKN